MKWSKHIEVIGSKSFHELIKSILGNVNHYLFEAPMAIVSALTSIQERGKCSKVVIVEEAAGHMEQAYGDSLEFFVKMNHCLYGRFTLQNGMVAHVLCKKRKFFVFAKVVFYLMRSNNFSEFRYALDRISANWQKNISRRIR